MGEDEDIEYVLCDMCGEEIAEEDAIYVEARPYCDDCYREAEINADVGE